MIEKTSIYYSSVSPNPGAMINPQWLKLLISRTNFHGPKDVWAREVTSYIWHGTDVRAE